jgi:hypothetical protein
MLSLYRGSRIFVRPHRVHTPCSKLFSPGEAFQAKRNYISLERLSQEFLDLAVALPLPTSLPPYSTTIFLVAVFTRLVFTVPASIWVGFPLEFEESNKGAVCHSGQATRMESSGDCHASPREIETNTSQDCPTGNASYESVWNQRGT